MKRVMDNNYYHFNITNLMVSIGIMKTLFT